MLRNYWYIGLKSRSLGRRPVPFELLDGQWVAWRDQAGQPQVVEDRCPHRRVPLSLGRVEHGRLQCGYHGWEFDGTGECTHVPSRRGVGKLCVPSLPAQERHGYLWVWAGDPNHADPSRIPDIPELTDPRFACTRITIPVDCDSRLSIENLLSPQHINFAHAGWTGSRHGMDAGWSLDVQELDGDVLRYTWVQHDHKPGLVERATGWAPRGASRSEVVGEYRPPDLMWLTGPGFEGGPIPQPIYLWSVPRGPGRCRLEILQCRSIFVFNPLNPLIRAVMHVLFRQDLDLLEAQERTYAAEAGTAFRAEVPEPADGALTRYRVLREKLLRREGQSPPDRARPAGA